MRFSFIDVLLLAGLGLSAFLGYRGGLAKKLFNLLMLLFAAVIAARFMHTVGMFFADAGVMGEIPSYVVAFMLIILAIMIPALVLYHRFGKTAGSLKSGTAVIGVLLGIIEGAMLISFILMGLKILEIPDEDTRQESLLYRPLVRFVPRTFELLESYFPGASEFKKELELRFKDAELFTPPTPPRRSI
jgi:uncharacterized membrane protein required for colicin V production